MRFQLPQFIETEIKIIGPFTLKQFMWIGAGGALLFLDFSVLSGYAAIIVAIPVAAIAVALAAHVGRNLLPADIDASLRKHSCLRHVTR